MSKSIVFTGESTRSSQLARSRFSSFSQEDRHKAEIKNAPRFAPRRRRQRSDSYAARRDSVRATTYRVCGASFTSTPNNEKERATTSLRTRYSHLILRLLFLPLGDRATGSTWCLVITRRGSFLFFSTRRRYAHRVFTRHPTDFKTLQSLTEF